MRLRILSLILLPLSAYAETITGKVVGVTDGDTITVLVEERAINVRLAEIDTPEPGRWLTSGRNHFRKCQVARA
jgi:endonuclease YncB( thermonuclease family)